MNARRRGHRRGHVGFGIGFGGGYHGRRHGGYYGRRHGGVGFGIGFGGGHRRYRRGYYGRPWYRRPWFGLYTTSSKSYLDSQEKGYWRVTNESNYQIRVSSDSSSIDLAPGQLGRLYRDRSFVIDLESPDTGKRKSYETKNHIVDVGRRLRVRTYFE